MCSFSWILRRAAGDGKFVSLLTLTLLSLLSLRAELNPELLEVLLPRPTCLGLEGRLDLNFCNIVCLGVPWLSDWTPCDWSIFLPLALGGLNPLSTSETNWIELSEIRKAFPFIQSVYLLSYLFNSIVFPLQNILGFVVKRDRNIWKIK